METLMNTRVHPALALVLVLGAILLLAVLTGTAPIAPEIALPIDLGP